MPDQPKTALDVLREIMIHLPQVIHIVEQKDVALAQDLSKHLEDCRKVLKAGVGQDAAVP
jgi:hypothetical protein